MATKEFNVIESLEMVRNSLTLFDDEKTRYQQMGNIINHVQEHGSLPEGCHIRLSVALPGGISTMPIPAVSGDGGCVSNEEIIRLCVQSCNNSANRMRELADDIKGAAERLLEIIPSTDSKEDDATS